MEQTLLSISFPAYLYREGTRARAHAEKKVGEGEAKKINNDAFLFFHFFLDRDYLKKSKE